MNTNKLKKQFLPKKKVEINRQTKLYTSLKKEKVLGY